MSSDSSIVTRTQRWTRAAARTVTRSTDGEVTKRAVLGTLALVTVVLTLIPLGFLVWTSFWSGFPGQLDASLTLDNFAAVYLRGAYDVVGLFANSVFVAVGMVVVAMGLGLLFAWLLVRTNLPTKGAIELVLISPYAVPGYIYALVYIATYGPEHGLVTTFLTDTVGLETAPIDVFSPVGIAFVVGIDAVTSFYLLTAPALQDMDPALEEVSRIHGAGVLRTVRSVSFPVILPAILSAFTVTFLRGLGEFSVVAILGAREGFDVYATAIWKAVRLRFPAEYGQSAALACSLLVATALLVWYYRRTTSRKRDFMTVTGHGYQPDTWDLGKWRWPLAGALWVVLFVVWILPVLVMVLVSLHSVWLGEPNLGALTLDNYATAVTDPALRTAFTNSVAVALTGATLGTVLVVGTAYYTERTDGRFRGLVDFCSLTPLAVPGIIMGASILFAFLWLGKLPVLDLYGTLWIIVIGSVVVFVPFSSRIAVGNVVQVHASLEEVARVFGASWLQEMREIFLPLFKNTTAVIWFYLLIHIFQLVTIAMMTYTQDTMVIPVKVFNLYTNEADIELISAVSVLFIGMTFLTLLVMRASGIVFYRMDGR